MFSCRTVRDTAMMSKLFCSYAFSGGDHRVWFSMMLCDAEKGSVEACGEIRLSVPGLSPQCTDTLWRTSRVEKDVFLPPGGI